MKLKWYQSSCGDWLTKDKRYRIVNGCWALLVSQHIEPPYGIPYTYIKTFPTLQEAQEYAETYGG